MNPSLFFLTSLSSLPFKVIVLAPSVQSNDENIDYYYDFSQSIEEYEKVFTHLNIPWQWQPVTIDDFPAIINNIANEKEAGNFFPIVFNLCDGDEINGSPGVSVISLLEQYELLYTGSNEYFYTITTSKIPMKQAFDKSNVATPIWESIQSKEQNLDGIFDRLGSPIIVKPAVSGGSMGVGIKNVVYNNRELKILVNQMFDGYRGWNLASDGLIAESFINGAEFTTLISGSYDFPQEAHVYDPVERIFHPSLPEHERFLSFDRLWEIYEEEKPMPNEENFYEYHLPDTSLLNAIKKISWDAYVATGGKGYTRVDIRCDSATGKLYVLEVNAQCGLSEDEDYTSIGAILRVNNQSFESLVLAILKDGYFNYIAKKEPQLIDK